MDIEKIREKLLLASLAHVPFDGWSEAALRAGAEDAGLSPGEALNAFPRGPAEAVEAFGQWADRRMPGISRAKPAPSTSGARSPSGCSR